MPAPDRYVQVMHVEQLPALAPHAEQLRAVPMLVPQLPALAPHAAQLHALAPLASAPSAVLQQVQAVPAQVMHVEQLPQPVQPVPELPAGQPLEPGFAPATLAGPTCLLVVTSVLAR